MNKCKWCGKSYRPSSHNQKFCSLSCKDKNIANKSVEVGREFKNFIRDFKQGRMSYSKIMSIAINSHQREMVRTAANDTWGFA